MSDYYNYAAQRESGGDPNAVNPRSTATGLYQFLEPTWADLMKRHPDLGLTPDGRTDPAQQQRAMARFTDENKGILTQAGFEPTRDNLYAAHRFGAAGATGLLRMDPNAPLEGALPPGVLQSNPDLRGKRVGDVSNPDRRIYGRDEPTPFEGAPAVPPMRAAMDLSGAAVRTPLQTAMAPPSAVPEADRALSGTVVAPSAKGRGVASNPNLFTRVFGSEGNGGADFGTNLQQAGIHLQSISNPDYLKGLPAVSKSTDNYTVTYDAKTGMFTRVRKDTGKVDTWRNPSWNPQQEAQDAYDKKSGEQHAETNTKIAQAATDNSDLLATIQKAREIYANPNVYQGALGEHAQSAKKVLSLLGKDPSGIAETDVARALGNELTQRARLLNGGLPGSLSNSDLVFLKNASIGLDKEPKANVEILDKMERSVRRLHEIDALRDAYVRENGRLDDGFYKKVRELDKQLETQRTAAPAVAAVSPGVAGPVAPASGFKVLKVH